MARVGPLLQRLCLSKGFASKQKSQVDNKLNDFHLSGCLTAVTLMQDVMEDKKQRCSST